jgi:hypothetical protein
MTPLEMARNAAHAVERLAQFQHEDQLGAYLAHAGDRGKSAAETAGCMALVAIAEDLHRIRELLERGPAPDDDEGFTETGPPLRKPSEPPP